MNNHYTATKRDLKIVDETIGLVLSKKLDFIFQNRNFVKHFLVVSFDSQHLYLWTTEKIPTKFIVKKDKNNIFFCKITHNLSLSVNDRLGWVARLKSEVKDLLPNTLKLDDFQLPKMSGSLFGDFLNNQLNVKGKDNNPYVTEQSYRSTLVHEFAHLYFNQHKSWWYSDKKHNISLIEAAMNGQVHQQVSIPSPHFFSELYAFMAELWVSKKFFPTHYAELLKFANTKLSNMIKAEKGKNLEKQNSEIENDPHDTSLVLGLILLKKHPRSWPKRITQRFLL